MSLVEIELFDHCLLLAAVACAASFVRMLQRRDQSAWGYLAWIGTGLLCSVFSIGGDRFVGTVVLCLVLATVVVPWLLEQGSRWAFARGRFVWVARAASLRAILTPGSGLSYQLPLLEGLSLLEREGADAALAHFRQLANDSDDGTELAVIHEQIVSMLFHSERWDEGIAYYERRFQTGYAALRPSLALGLLRAYGEAGRLERAALLLRELEEGPVGRDPKTAELLGQARLTFLAYAGAVAPVDEVLRRERFGDLGLSQATAALFKGIAQTRAGSPDDALETLSGIDGLAGPGELRVQQAAKALLARVRSGGPELDDRPSQSGGEGGDADGQREPLPEELRAYIDVVAERLRDFLHVAAPVHRHGRPLATYAIITGLSAVYGLCMLYGGGGLGLLEIGALSEDLWRRGSWYRVLSATWIHVDLISLLFDVYALWLAGQIVERVLGRSRMVLVSVGAALAGMAACVMSLSLWWELGWSELAVVAPIGGNLIAVGAIVASLWLLLPRFTPPLELRMRRNLAVTLVLLLLATGLSGWSPIANGLAPAALVTTMLTATAVVWALPLSPPRALRGALSFLALALGLASAGAFIAVAAEAPEPYLVEHRSQRCQAGQVELSTPIAYAPTQLDRDGPYAVPIVDGLVDSLELHSGALVQIGSVVLPAGEPDIQPELALFEAVPGLGDKLSVTASGRLPEALLERMAADEVGSWRSADLWSNGERVARYVERRLEPVPTAEGTVGEGVVVYLLAAPAEAIEHGAQINAAILVDAKIDEALAEDTQHARVRCTVE